MIRELLSPTPQAFSRLHDVTSISMLMPTLQSKRSCSDLGQHVRRLVGDLFMHDQAISEFVGCPC